MDEELNSLFVLKIITAELLRSAISPLHSNKFSLKHAVTRMRKLTVFVIFRGLQKRNKMEKHHLSEKKLS